MSYIFILVGIFFTSLWCFSLFLVLKHAGKETRMKYKEFNRRNTKYNILFIIVFMMLLSAKYNLLTVAFLILVLLFGAYLEHKALLKNNFDLLFCNRLVAISLLALIGICCLLFGTFFDAYSLT